MRQLHSVEYEAYNDTLRNADNEASYIMLRYCSATQPDAFLHVAQLDVPSFRSQATCPRTFLGKRTDYIPGQCLDFSLCMASSCVVLNVLSTTHICID